MLTPRELYLVRQAYRCGYDVGFSDGEKDNCRCSAELVDGWLDETISDGGHTVEMLLSHEATERTKEN